ncbi:MAG: nucleoside 2-deoxyribosyltransferase [bacterium]|nr:nucleoside 2-deoxyribosyltransferase [bacterium]
MNKKKIYVASPLGFSEAGRDFLYNRVIPIVEEAGFIVIDPWKLTSGELINSVMSMPFGGEQQQEWIKLNKIIGENNVKGINESDGLVAVLDGCDVDSGTASEIGYASAQGKPMIGYRGDFRLAGDNHGSIVNLQVEYFIYRNGGVIINQVDNLRDELGKLF